MRPTILLLMIAFPTGFCSQIAKSAQWTTVDRVCRTVVLTDVANMSWSYHASTKPVPDGAEVILYHRDKKKKCCDAEQFVAQKTNREWPFRVRRYGAR